MQIETSANSKANNGRTKLPFLSFASHVGTGLRWLPFLAICLVFSAIFSDPSIADEITIVRNGKTTSLTGDVIIEAKDKSVLFRSPDGQISIISAEEIEAKTIDDKEVEPLTKKELAKQLLAELPEGFKTFDSGQFVIAYQTEKAYARWVGGLYSRLFRGFNTYWTKKKKFKLSKPEYPLGVIIFSHKAEYDQFVKRELGLDAGAMVAYYNLLTNRVAMYDLTANQLPPGNDANARRITEVLNQPAAIPMVATVIHEGTHQLMFNTGMQTRFSDTPLWINEGLAMYFETPDLKSSRGWGAIGRVNPMRLNHFRANLNQRRQNSLQSMLSSDKVFQNPNTKLLAYSESWAFCYFLLNKHSEEFVRYLKHMAAKKPQEFDTPEQRLADFKNFLGEDLNALDREFIQYIRKLSN